MTKLKITALCVLIALCASATQYSKLAIITSAKLTGYWPTLKSFIAEAELEDEWAACQYLSDDYPAFATITNSLVQNCGISNDALTNILHQATDTAVPDNLLLHVYTNDCATKSGRIKWHGKLVKEIIDTNTWTKTMIYEDGKCFTDKAPRKTQQQIVNEANARRARAVKTNGIPARLAAARLKLQQNQSITNEVTVSLTAGK